ncbi:unnamed protein product [Dibothriocephalus latus]|uniref:Uncharacterized protein n=1 Tax=Dibothriocephalus latus TaxID=60516 RepID=A0A3P6SDF6_DIBLA|nr:unnamed protein product [Dibothriocephalus latus]
MANADKCITEDTEIVGYAQVANDRSLAKTMTEIREGPKALQYIPKTTSNAVGKDFPEVEEKPFVCEKEKMDMLVTTVYRTADTAPWEYNGVYRPDPNDPLAKYVNEVRIEFHDNKVNQGDNLPGRVFLDLKEPTRLDQVIVDLNDTMVGVDKNGTVKPKWTDKNKPQTTQPQPTTFRVVPTVDTSKRVTLPAGTNAIPFEIQVPKGAIPTFNYVSPKDGASVVNSYSAEGVTRLNGKTARTDRVTVDVKGLGDTQGGLGFNDANNEVAIAKKYVKKGTGIDYGLGQKKDSDQKKNDDVEASVVQHVRCPPVGINDTTTLKPDLKPSKSSKSSSSVINNYNEDPTNTSKLPNDNLSNVFEQENAPVKADLPSITTKDFESNYKLKLKGGDAAYEAPFALVDDLKQGWRPTHLTQPTSIRRA